MSHFISLRGCRLHNLKNIDADFPIQKITVVCGPSGCGKSTLVLDTLHGECKRRYLETLSPFAVELLGGKRSIPLTSAEGLSASLAIGPGRGEAPAKSTALSLSECDDALTALFATFASPACPLCGSSMEFQTREAIIRETAGLPLGSKLQFFAPVDPEGHTLDKLSAVFLAQGFTRAVTESGALSLADLTDDLKHRKPKEFFIVVDRIIVRENTRTRIAEAVDATLKLTHGSLTLDIGGERKIYSTTPRCPHDTDIDHQKSPEYAAARNLALAPKLFSSYSSASTRPEIQGASIDGVSWQQVIGTPFGELQELLHSLFDSRLIPATAPSFSVLLERIQAIKELGLSYLTPGRPGPTLSGGEMQRLRLASLSTGHLNGLLICLDEPASGLHRSDVEKLWNILLQVQARGNTLVLIEHHPEIIRRSDYLIEMGPGAGEKGGEILFAGPREDILQHPESPTAQWIAKLEKNRKKKPDKDRATPIDHAVPLSDLTDSNDTLPQDKSPRDASVIKVRNFHMYDMENVNADIPIGKFSVITGQSGSGKSTLLFENIAKRAEAGEFKGLGIEELSVLATGDFHGNRRSTVASAIGLLPLLRELFAKLPESKIRGYNATKFSLHVSGGRCENCKGEGVIFDPSGYEETECPVCLGRRFRDEVLEIRFKSLSIADLLDLEIGNALKIFANLNPFVEKLKPLVDTGLDYLKLGQTTAHLSGGERARLRLSIALARAKAPHTLFLFDEPARGLHQDDIQHLLTLIHGLNQKGHTVIAIEHAEDFIQASDYTLELKRRD